MKETPLNHLLILLLLLAITVAVYYPGLSGDYMFDDLSSIVENTRLDIDDLNLDSIKGASLSSDSGMLRRPVSMFSFALNRYFFGTDPYAHKVINLLIHLLNGIGLFLLSRLLLRGYRHTHDPGFATRAEFWLPVVIAGLWMLHPINLSSVLYIVQRMTSLATLFTICGLCLYVLGRLRMLAGKRGLPMILGGLVGFGGLSIFSKESGALLPLYMLAIEFTLFRFRNSIDSVDKSITVLFIGVICVPAVLIITYFALNPSFILGGYGLRDFTFVERLLTEGRVLVFYLRLIILPSLSELGLYHDDIAISHGLLDPPTTLYSWVALAAIISAAFFLLKKAPLFSLGIFWFFVGHILESSIIALEIAHEHRNYLADYGIILAAASLIAQAPLRRLGPLVRVAVPIMLLMLFSLSTWLRAEQWSDNLRLATYEARHHPKSGRAVLSAGRAYTQLALSGRPDQADKAYSYLLEAARLDETGIMAEVLIIILNYHSGSSVNPIWYKQVLHKLSVHPVTPADISSLHELSLCAATMCKIPENILEEIFNSALENESLKGNPILHAKTLAVFGFYTINTRSDYNKGLNISLQAVELHPSDPRLWENLIVLLTEMNRLDEAEEQLEKYRSTQTHGGSINDYRRLQEAIDLKRRMTIYQTNNP